MLVTFRIDEGPGEGVTYEAELPEDTTTAYLYRTLRPFLAYDLGIRVRKMTLSAESPASPQTPPCDPETARTTAVELDRRGTTRIADVPFQREKLVHIRLE